jgi:hypothetical protein
VVAFGAGPFEVVAVVGGHGDQGRGLVLKTALGEHELPESWLEADD